MVREIKVVCKGLHYTGTKLLIVYVVLNEDKVTEEEICFKGKVTDHKNVGKIYTIVERQEGTCSISKQPEGIYQDENVINTYLLISKANIDKYNMKVKKVNYSKALTDELDKLKKLYQDSNYYDRKMIEDSLISYLRDL